MEEIVKYIDRQIESLESWERGKTLNDYRRGQLYQLKELKEAFALTAVSCQREQLTPIPQNECSECGVLINHRLTCCSDCER